MLGLSRRLRARAAPTLIIGRPASWPIRIAALLMALAAGGALGVWWGGRSASPSGAASSQAGDAQEQARQLERTELARLQAIANAADSQIKIGLCKIKAIIGGHQHEAQLGIRLSVSRQPRAEPFRRKVTRSSNRQRLRCLPRLHRANSLFKLQEAGAEWLQTVFGFGRQFKTFWGSPK